jgi:hypothetical protein
LIGKAIEYITGSAIERDSIQFEANKIAFRYKGQKTFTDISQKLIEDTIRMHRKSLEGRYADGGEAGSENIPKWKYVKDDWGDCWVENGIRMVQLCELNDDSEKELKELVKKLNNNPKENNSVVFKMKPIPPRDYSTNVDYFFTNYFNGYKTHEEKELFIVYGLETPFVEFFDKFKKDAEIKKITIEKEVIEMPTDEDVLDINFLKKLKKDDYIKISFSSPIYKFNTEYLTLKSKQLDKDKNIKKINFLDKT